MESDEDIARAAARLGLAYPPSQQAIKRAYRASVLAYHPDRHAGASPQMRKFAQGQFKLVNNANELLTRKWKETPFTVEQGMRLPNMNQIRAEQTGARARRRAPAQAAQAAKEAQAAQAARAARAAQVQATRKREEGAEAAYDPQAWNVRYAQTLRNAAAAKAARGTSAAAAQAARAAQVQATRKREEEAAYDPQAWNVRYAQTLRKAAAAKAATSAAAAQAARAAQAVKVQATRKRDEAAARAADQTAEYNWAQETRKREKDSAIRRKASDAQAFNARYEELTRRAAAAEGEFNAGAPRRSAAADQRDDYQPANKKARTGFFERWTFWSR